MGHIWPEGHCVIQSESEFEDDLHWHPSAAKLSGLIKHLSLHTQFSWHAINSKVSKYNKILTLFLVNMMMKKNFFFC